MSEFTVVKKLVIWAMYDKENSKQGWLYVYIWGAVKSENTSVNVKLELVEECT